MVLAVVYRDPYVLHGIARDRTRFEHLPHAFLHRGYVLVRDHAAFHRVDELEARAALERLDAQIDFAELARAAGLFLVPVMAFRFGADRFAVRDAGRLGG